MTLRARAKKLAYLAGLTASVSLASLMISPKANAVTYTLLTPAQTQSFGSTATNLNGNPTLTFSKYNSVAAGTNVTEIDFTLASKLISQGSITSGAADSNNVIVKTELDKFYFQSPQGTQITFIDSTLVDPDTGTPIVSPFTIAYRNYGTVPQNSTLAFGNSTGKIYNNIIKISDPTIIQQFLGTGNYSLSPYTQIPVVVSSNGGNITTQISTFADANLKVEYYGTAPTTVPFELSSDSVIIPCAGTLVGISLWKRKRQRAQA